MPEIVVGPLLRYVGRDCATVWVETDAPCTVDVLGHSDRTFCVEGHHYALVVVEGLEPGSEIPYEVALDGERRWPPANEETPPSIIRTLSGDDTEIIISYGSCRLALPHEPPYTLAADKHELGSESDALHVFAHELRRDPEGRWPHLLLLLGDQIYVDEGSPGVREFVRSRRDTSKPPGDEVVDFEEYARLYRESWSEPLVRWLLSTVPTAMIIDDHDMADDWNISLAWIEEMNRKPWWRERVLAGFATYWLYQHLGNLSPRELAADETFKQVRESGDDAAPVLREYARRAYEQRNGIRWSYRREVGRTRVIVLDSRGGRVLAPGRRAVLGAEERAWLRDEIQGDFDHLVLATSDPLLMTPGFHYLEVWNERICDGAWGRMAARLGERMRQAVDFDHWPAFGRSFTEMAALLRDLGAGEWGAPPASIVIVSGDVHHAYLAETAFRRDAGVRSPIYQAVCSPFRNALTPAERRVVGLSATRGATALARLLARAAGAPDPELRWRLCEGPFFSNQIGTLRLLGRQCRAKLEKTTPEHEGEESLELSYLRRLA